MENKTMAFDIRGMQRDLGEAKNSPMFAYDNRNIRFTPRDGNTLLTMTNERGNKQISLFSSNGNASTILGTVLGHCVLNSTLIIFTKHASDYIYKIYKADDKYIIKTLFNGDLNFNVEYPIETLGLYENEDLQKVYWVDGLNQPRVININKEYTHNEFDFALSPDLNSVLTITKNDSSNGSFKAGVIQYAYTFYNKNAQETPILNLSPIYYISPKTIGLEENSSSNNSFTVNISNISNYYDYVRIYSIYRSSIDGTPEVSIVGDYKPIAKVDSSNMFKEGCSLDDILVCDNAEGTFKKASSYPPDEINTNLRTIDFTYADTIIKTVTKTIKIGATRVIFMEDIYSPFIYIKTPYGKVPYEYTGINIVDNNNNIESVDPTLLLYLGSEVITANTIAQKDNTLFLGNIELKQETLQNFKYKGLSIKEYFNKYNTIGNFTKRTLISPVEEPIYYDYDINNNYPSSEYKVFKYREHYRLGVQLLHKTGKWSEVIHLKDVVNKIPISINKVYNGSGYDYFYETGTFSTVFADSDLVNALVEIGYTKIRPVVCYPSLQDRKIIAQGIVCPTVYNFKDRYDNAPYVQSSWFFRPIDNIDNGKNLPVNGSGNRGSYPECRDGFGLSNTSVKNSEYQLQGGSTQIFPDDGNYEAFKDRYGYKFAVDSNIITFHSPDIENSSELDDFSFDGLDFRIVGMAPVESHYGSMKLQVNNSGPNNGKFVTTPIAYNSGDISSSGKILSDSLSNAFSGKDRIIGSKISTVSLWNDKVKYGNGSYYSNYFIYPWHTSASIIGDGDNCKISKKILSNSMYSSKTIYFDNSDVINYDYGISTPQAYHPDNYNSILKLKAPLNSTLGDVSYSGSINSVYTGSFDTKVGDFCTGWTSENTPIIPSGGLSEVELSLTPLAKKYTSITVNAPLEMKYKSSKHLVFGFNFKNTNTCLRLPDFDEDTRFFPSAPFYFKGSISGYYSTIPNPSTDSDPNMVKYINKYFTDKTNNLSYLFVAELYRKYDSGNAFGGNTDEAISKNKFEIAGDAVDLSATIPVYFTVGDTYFQRYDCLKTYSYDDNSINNVIDIASVMCESRVNLNLRYDRNRGLRDNTSITSSNFNKFNTVYNQSNNYFLYNTLLPSQNLNKFFNTVTWSKVKVSNEDIDTWTNVTLASTLDLDGDKGILRSIKRFNNELYAFQDKGISRILFNSRVQIPTSDGVPVEIANSMKVDGKVYITDNMGTSNKWSIITTPIGIYFIDNLNSSISILNSEGIFSLSDKLGFRSFIGDVNSLDVWNPIFNNNGFRTMYDATEDDVYFINKDHCLCYSELLQQFTSFYSYEGISNMFNVDNKFYSIKDGSLWEQNAGEYNNYFGVIKPYSTTVIVNQEPNLDKIFNTVEYTMDVKDSSGKELSNKTFTNMDAWNNYQENSITLVDQNNKPSNLKRKFRIWRANIPRSRGTRDRMRGPWLYLKLEDSNPSNNISKLYTLNVNYFG